MSKLLACRNCARVEGGGRAVDVNVVGTRRQVDDIQRDLKPEGNAIFCAVGLCWKISNLLDKEGGVLAMYPYLTQLGAVERQITGDDCFHRDG